MEVYIEKGDKTENISVEGSKELKMVLKEMGISVDSVILVKNDEICLEDEMVNDEDKIKLLSVVSGG